MLSFPPDFLWGTATAAHQVEGQNFNNDLWDWEQIPGKIRNGDSSRVACDWWNGRYREDFDRAKEGSQNAHRLSVEWSRIEPRPNEFDSVALAHYRQMLRALLDRGLEPMVTLHHFTNPRWFLAQGGWENPRLLGHFPRFAERVARELGDLCRLWVTFNEPNVYTYNAYSVGTFPPGKKDFGNVLRVLVNLIRAHAASYHAIKRVQPSAQVGIAHHFRYFYPFRANSPLDRLTVFLRDRIFNWLIFLAVQDGRLRFPLSLGQSLPEARGTQDFIGVNYYYTDRVVWDWSRAGEMFGRSVPHPYTYELKKLFTDAMNVEDYGLEFVLRWVTRFKRPIYITENGIFDAGDGNQPRYLITHLMAAHRAMQAGADVKGHFWWTLVDNFEWTQGYTPRFGLYQLDLETQTRSSRPVAALYARIARENQVADDLIAEYGERSGAPSNHGRAN